MLPRLGLSCWLKDSFSPYVFLHRTIQFQAFSACVCLAAVCIRAPSSSLALSALQELELGVSLFEAAKIGSRAREELVSFTFSHSRNCLLSYIWLRLTRITHTY